MTAHARGYLRHVAPQCGPCLKAQDTMIPQGRQSPAHWGFVAVDQPYDCGQCIARHAAHFQFPELAQEHVEAWNLMLTLHDQQRMGMEPIGLDYAVLPAVFTMVGIDRARWRVLFEQLVALNHVWQQHYVEQRDRKREQDEAKRKLQGGRR